MNLKGIFAGAAIVAVLVAAAPASAATYSLVADYNNAAVDGPWSFGTGIGAAQVTFTTPHASGGSNTGCFGNNGFECLNSGGATDLPGVGKVTSGHAENLVTTVDVPTDVVWMHPGDGSANSPNNVSIVFTAPTTSAYTLDGFFERLSNQNSGNGVLLQAYINGAPAGSLPLPETAGYGAKLNFTGTVLNLNAGDKLTFLVNNNGEYTFDSTGLNATLTSAAPEPATWATIMLGLFGLGGLLRRRQQGLGAAVA
jgi:hypothetical protein